MIKNELYYIKKPKGYNPCILGNPAHRDPVLNVLPNCVGWATGRFNELGNYGECKYLGNKNAENFIEFVKIQNLILSQTPQKGSCMVWEGKGDLAGHVAIVEEVVNVNEIIDSESGWSFKVPYKNKTRKKGTNGRWGMASNYTFKGFIYNPVFPILVILPARGYFKKGDKGNDIIKINDWLYEKYKNKKTLGIVFGKNTETDVKKFQAEAKKKGQYNDKIDGKIGKKTLKAMRENGFAY
ncbi:MAG: CHAP domain-containing protein [Bacillota bacterium]|nr:CHAP domain-containing protein [Bacillota bacterium]